MKGSAITSLGGRPSPPPRAPRTHTVQRRAREQRARASGAEQKSRTAVHDDSHAGDCKAPVQAHNAVGLPSLQIDIREPRELPSAACGERGGAQREDRDGRQSCRHHVCVGGGGGRVSALCGGASGRVSE